MSELKETRRLLKVVHDLRTQCPWDRKQTHRTLLPYLVEESYEAVEALQSGNTQEMREELGDLLLQIALHAEIAGEKGRFNFEEVARGIADKMIRRHPHVYGDEKAADAAQHKANWTKLKEKEKGNRLLLEGTPRSMPSLTLAQRYGEIAGSVDFDWENAEQVLAKLDEEIAELKRALRKRKGRKAAVREEMGDVFFTLANLARHLGLDAEATSKAGALKFAKRFTRLERFVRRAGKRITDANRGEMEKAWKAIKGKLRR